MGAGAAVIIIKERHIVEAFERAGAISAERAVAPSDLNVDTDRVPWALLERHGIAVDAGGGKWFVDAAAWRGHVRKRRLTLGTVLLLILLALAAYQIIAPKLH